MYISFGSYNHAPWEANLVNWTIRPRLSARGFLISSKVEGHVSGDFVATSGDTQYDIATKVSALKNALATPGGDFGLRHDDGTPSPEFLYNDHSSNLTGNRCLYQSFPSQEGNAEYATGRSFSYVVAAEIFNPETLLLEYQETITHNGTTGPLIEWRNTINGPRWDVLFPSTFQEVVQYGYAVSLGTYIIPPAPILTVPYNLVHRNVIERTSPKRYPQGFEGYVTRWKYVFNSHTPVAVFPSTR